MLGRELGQMLGRELGRVGLSILIESCYIFNPICDFCLIEGSSSGHMHSGTSLHGNGINSLRFYSKIIRVGLLHLV